MFREDPDGLAGPMVVDCHPIRVGSAHTAVRLTVVPTDRLSGSAEGLAGASVGQAFSSLVQSAEIAVLHVLRVTHRVADLFAGQLPVHTLILATSKLIKGRQANLRFWHTSLAFWAEVRITGILGDTRSKLKLMVLETHTAGDAGTGVGASILGTHRDKLICTVTGQTCEGATVTVGTVLAEAETGGTH